MYQILCLEQGEMLPDFSPQMFWGDSKYQVLCSEQREMLPNFSPWAFWSDSMHQILCLEQGEVLPNFRQELLGLTQNKKQELETISPCFGDSNHPKKFEGKSWAAFPPFLKNFDKSNHRRKLGSISPRSEHKKFDTSNDSKKLMAKIGQHFPLF